MELIILYLPLFILIHSFYSLPINPGFPVNKLLRNNEFSVFRGVISQRSSITFLEMKVFV